MRKHLVQTLCVASLLMGGSGLAVAGGPTLMNYQGQLDTGTVAFNGNVNMTFSVYSVATGGSALWTEAHSGVNVQGGLFNVILGSNTALTDAVFSGPNRWLGITVGADPEMNPRTRITSVAYSHRVTTVDGATGGVISGDVSVQSDLSVSGKSTIGPGHTNIGVLANVAGGNNTVSGDSSVVSGGYGNTASGANTAVGGGWNNSASGRGAAIGGGGNNTASNVGASVGGGASNDAAGVHSSVSGGIANAANGDVSTVGGGTQNIATANTSTIGGGLANTTGGIQSTVSGGGRNAASGDSATVGGGTQNSAEGEGATVSGGHANRVTASFYSTIGGGIGDTASGWYNTIAGGQGNNTSNNYSAVAGGGFNAASGFAASVGGGQTNQATGDYATVAGGQSNRAIGDRSMASGFRAVANHDGSYVWADDTNVDFATTGTDQYLIRASGGVGIGTNNPSSELDVAGDIQASGAIASGSGQFGTAWANSTSNDTLLMLRNRGRMEVYGTLNSFRLVCNAVGGSGAFMEYFVELYDKPTNTWSYFDGTMAFGDTLNFTSLSSNPGTAVQITLTDANDGYMATWQGALWNNRLAGTYITSHP